MTVTIPYKDNMHTINAKYIVSVNLINKRHIRLTLLNGEALDFDCLDSEEQAKESYQDIVKAMQAD